MSEQHEHYVVVIKRLLDAPLVGRSEEVEVYHDPAEAERRFLELDEAGGNVRLTLTIARPRVAVGG